MGRWTAQDKQALQDRLIRFAVMTISVSTKLSSDRVGSNLGNQLVRSGTSPALNYAEAMGAESPKDFIHKIKIVLKELRETAVCLKILAEISYFPDNQEVHDECNQLIAIFVTSIVTARRNSVKK